MGEEFAKMWKSETGKRETARWRANKTSLEAVWSTKLKILTV